MNNLNVKDIEMVIVVEDGLRHQFKTFKDVLRSTVYSARQPHSDIALALKLTPNMLTRMMAENENDTARFPANLVVPLILFTGDLRPVQWLVCTLLESPEQKREKALDQAVELLPQLERTLELLQGAASG